MADEHNDMSVANPGGGQRGHLTPPILEVFLCFTLCLANFVANVCTFCTFALCMLSPPPPKKIKPWIRLCGMCCSGGKVNLFYLSDPPELLKSLLTFSHSFSKHFLDNFRYCRWHRLGLIKFMQATICPRSK